MTEKNTEIVSILSGGGVAVIPTDTIYGLVGQALNPVTVERIYGIKKRAPEKPCIILVSDILELSCFAVTLSEIQKEKIKEYWPGPVSVIVDIEDTNFEYLDRGTGTLAFRLPGREDLVEIIKQTGPLIAPSANPEGMTPAGNISEARAYFGEAVDAYLDGGDISGKASKIIKLEKDGGVTVIRE